LAAVVFFAPIGANADQFTSQISALNGQIASAQQQAQAAQSQANTISGQISIIDAQIASVTAQLQLSRTQQAQTQTQITNAQNQLTTKKGILDEEVRAIYQDSQVTPLEELASSQNLSDFVDKQQYNDQIKDHIQDELAEINTLKAQLEQQQAALNVQISQEAGLSATLSTQQAQQSQLLAEAQGNVAAANASIASKNSQVAKLDAEEAATLQAASRSYSGSVPGASSGSGGACDDGNGNGGYPAEWCNAAQDSLIDSWGMYNRECVSWAAWRRADIGRPIPGGWGNANQWANAARAAGYTVDNTPQVGAIAQTDAGPYGHVAIVEAIQGSDVIVSEMNYDDAGHYRLGTYAASYFDYIH
jgi:surface antigen